MVGPARNVAVMRRSIWACVNPAPRMRDCVKYSRRPLFPHLSMLSLVACRIEGMRASSCDAPVAWTLSLVRRNRWAGACLAEPGPRR